MESARPASHGGSCLGEPLTRESAGQPGRLRSDTTWPPQAAVQGLPQAQPGCTGKNMQASGTLACPRRDASNTTTSQATHAHARTHAQAQPQTPIALESTGGGAAGHQSQLHRTCKRGKHHVTIPIALVSAGGVRTEAPTRAHAHARARQATHTTRTAGSAASEPHTTTPRPPTQAKHHTPHEPQRRAGGMRSLEIITNTEIKAKANPLEAARLVPLLIQAGSL